MSIHRVEVALSLKESLKKTWQVKWIIKHRKYKESNSNKNIFARIHFDVYHYH